jgi:hypothetical protein
MPRPSRIFVDPDQDITIELLKLHEVWEEDKSDQFVEAWIAV